MTGFYFYFTGAETEVREVHAHVPSWSVVELEFKSLFDAKGD